MREFGKIGSVIWRSQKFRALKSDDARLAYFYLHTNELGNAAGCYCLPEPIALNDLRWTKPRYRKALADLVRVNLIETDSEEACVYLVNYLRFNPVDNRNNLIHLFKVLEKVPSQELADKRRNELKRLRIPLRRGFGGVSNHRDRDLDLKKEKKKESSGVSRNGALARHVTAARAPTEAASKGKPSNGLAGTLQGIPSAPKPVNAEKLTPEELAKAEAEAEAFIAGMRNE